MTRFFSNRHRLFAGSVAFTFVVVGLAAAMAQGQVAVPKSKLPTTQAVVKPAGNVLPQMGVGAAWKLPRELVNLTNQARQQAGLKPLVVKRALTGAAYGHAKKMAEQDNMSHELNGKKVADRLKDIGYTYSYCGENIAMVTDAPTAQRIFDMWMNSPGHRANILSPNFTEISIAMEKSASGRSYFCQVFGAPR